MGKTLRSKLILYNFLSICLVSVFVSACSYITTNKKTVEVTKNSIKYEVKQSFNTYINVYEDIINFILNSTERGFINLNTLNNLESKDGKKIAMLYSKNINDFCNVVDFGKYISRISLFNEEGALIQAGNSLASSNDYERILESDWFRKESQKSIEVYNLEKVTSPFYGDEEQIMPIVKRFDNNSGWMLVCLSTKFFQDELNDNIDGNEVVVSTSNGNIIASIDSDENNEREKIIQLILSKDEKNGYEDVNINGKKSLVYYEKDTRSGILVYKRANIYGIENNIELLIQTILIMMIACLGIGLILSIVFTSKVNKPINSLVKHIEGIGDGKFSKDKSLETEDEIGLIGKGINNMLDQINTLMDEKVKYEKEKSSLELKMLQSQINPHFIYNTLDSIKWIAIIQKNTGIIKLVTSFSALLKNMAKGFDEKITLEKELEFLNDYIVIEKIRYVELFDVDILIDNCELKKAKIIKLTLQPLVENAIFSGIEPSGKNGLIKINIFTKEDKLYIKVRDNGVGIPKDKLDDILKSYEVNDSKKMNGIGLSNVDRRIKLVYGNEYGITIESEVDNFTEITIVMPLEY